MDIYLNTPEFERERQQHKELFEKYVRLRDTASTPEEEARYQQKVEEYFNKMHCAASGYFRVNYNDYSLSYWLLYNIDEQAKAEWGIEPFWSAIKERKQGEEPIVDSDEFRQHLVETVQRWYEKALTLKDQESVLYVLNFVKNGTDYDQMRYKKVILKPEETNSYINWLKELLDFAQVAHKTQSPIYVSA